MHTPWKESYDQPRQRIKKQRHYFVNKGPSSQGYGFSSGHVWMWELDNKESWAPRNWCFWTVVLEKTWESLGLQGDPSRPSQRRSVLGVHWKDWCWSWNSNTLAAWWEELTHWKRPWCWEGLGAGGEGDDRGWDGWMASPTRWAWIWVNSGSWWWTGRHGVLRFMGSQRVGHAWATELNWTELRRSVHLWIFLGAHFIPGVILHSFIGPQDTCIYCVLWGIAVEIDWVVLNHHLHRLKMPDFNNFIWFDLSW